MTFSYHITYTIELKNRETPVYLYIEISNIMHLFLYLKKSSVETCLPNLDINKKWYFFIILKEEEIPF